jgi:hypothetical protein
MENSISNVMPKKSFIQRIKSVLNEPKPTEQEIKCATMLNILFSDQSTEEVIDTLIMFEEKAKARLKQIRTQAETDRFVTDFYLGTTSKKITI